MKTNTNRLAAAAIIMSAVTGFTQTINWTGGGDAVSWNKAANWAGGAVPGSANDVVITGGAGTSVVLSGSTTIKSIQCTKTFTLSGGYCSVTTGASLLQGPLNMSASSWLSASGSNTTLACTGPVSIDGGQLYVNGGATLSLPSLRNYRQTYPTYIDWQVSDAGSVLDLPGLTNLVGGASGSYLNLSALAGGKVSATNLVTITNGSVLATATGGTILVPRLAVGQWLWLNVGAGGSISASQLTNMDGGQLYVSGGATLWLPSLRNYQQIHSSAIDWQASGAGSVLDLPGLTNLVGGAAGLQLNLNALTGGQVIATNLVTITNGSVQATATGGSILVPRLAVAQWLWINVGAAGSISAEQLTNMDGGQLYVSGGATLSLPSLRKYQQTHFSAIDWQASGAGSVLDLPGLTNLVGGASGMQLNLNALTGGQVSATNLVTIANGYVQITATGGNILVPRLAAAQWLWMNVGAAGSISAGQLANIDGGQLYVSGGATLSLPSLQNYRQTHFSAIDWQASGAGSVLDLPGLTNLAGGPSVWLQVQALGGGRVASSNVVAIAEGFLSFLSNGTGSVIDLRNLSGFVIRSAQGKLEATNGGVILLSDQAFLLANVAINISSGNPILPPTVIPSSSLTLYGKPWHSYWVERLDTSSPASGWQFAARIPLTSAFQLFGSVPPPNMAYRVWEFVANPAIIDIWRLAGHQAQLVLYSTTNLPFRVETTSSLELLPASWATWAATGTMTNTFRILPAFSTSEPKQFFRSKQL